VSARGDDAGDWTSRQEGIDAGFSRKLGRMKWQREDIHICCQYLYRIAWLRRACSIVRK